MKFFIVGWMFVAVAAWRCALLVMRRNDKMSPPVLTRDADKAIPNAGLMAAGGGVRNAHDA